MSKKPYTRGPYAVEPLLATNGADIAIVSPSNGYVVAVIQCDPDIQTTDNPDAETVVWHGNEFADAELLRGAPEMVDALRDIYTDDDGDGYCSAEAMAKIRALLDRIDNPPVPSGYRGNDDDLATASEGFNCQSCGRPEADCSADPCAAVIADRGEGDFLFTVIWGNIGDGDEKRLDHVRVASRNFSAVMDAAFECHFAYLEEGGETLSDEERREMRENAAYDGYAIIEGHVTDADGLSFT